jgi:molybdate transport system substrate-binding protein
MKKALILILALCMAAAMIGCDASNTAPLASTSPAASSASSSSPAASSSASADNVNLTIAAAASLTDVSKELIDAYKKVAPNVTLTFTYGASGALQTQIEQGAPVDIFMSAAQKQMDALETGKLLLDGSRVKLLENKVVLIVPADSKLGLKSFEDVAGDTVKKVALGDPASVPAGQYAEEVFTSLKILDKVKAKANYGSDVRQVLTWVESGEVECGVVYSTDAKTTDKVTVVCEAPEGSVKAIIYPAAIVKASKHATEAQAFIDFLKSPDATALFVKYGFKAAA